MAQEAGNSVRSGKLCKVASFQVQGDRVVLRDIRSEDEDAFCAWASDEDMYEYMGFRWADSPGRRFRQLFNHPSRLATPRLNYYVAVLRGDGGAFVGVAALEVDDAGIAEVGFYLASPFWDRGLGSDVAALWVRVARDIGAQALTATCDPLNHPSRRVIEKTGLVLVSEDEVVRTWKGERPRLRFAMSL